MNLVRQYRAFKEDLQGFSVTTFDEFRAHIAPLRKSHAWTPADDARVCALHAAGAGYALQRLCGYDHPCARRVLGPAPIARERFSATELDANMRTLIRSCRNADWDGGLYEKYIRYLDSDTGPEGLRDDPESASKVPEEDEFATMFRKGGPAFKRHIVGCLTAAAAAATPPPAATKKKKKKKAKGTKLAIVGAVAPLSEAQAATPAPAPLPEAQAAAPAPLQEAAAPAPPLPDWAARLADLLVTDN
jgi:hypothetical protein